MGGGGGFLTPTCSKVDTVNLIRYKPFRRNLKGDAGTSLCMIKYSFKLFSRSFYLSILYDSAHLDLFVVLGISIIPDENIAIGKNLKGDTSTGSKGGGGS